ncbi:efflux RND transporter periplasmic adaptor subunit [Paraliomyxa miuraensis]|uniref:efflux RND transporter periplasmic adaptor subunit n=1 Tax=Paraliomyxa miuraensis TaxID=376150 RepID=UPI002253E0F8|nr:efflux RND transporter periplasmic adaptor subunit [Paraliomyxa miuraensis]MCX4248110.1 efflux RND transporter periplasmic adaptor subunit [Paraliomyxa miuraensis]
MRPVEAELGTIHLTPESIAKLGLTTTQVEPSVEGRVLELGGVVTLPPGQALAVTAPLAGTLRAGDRALSAGATVKRGDVLLRLVPFAPADRDMHAQARRQRRATQARVELAQERVERTRALLEHRGASQRALEEAEAELETARAEDEAARAREHAVRRSPMAADATLTIHAPVDGVLRTIAAAPDELVSGGALLFEVAHMSSPWVRVPVYPGLVDRLALDQPVRVARLGSGPSQGAEAFPVDAPPSAAAIGSTIDLYYSLPSPDPSSSDPGPQLRPDERVVVQLRQADPEGASAVPDSAVVLDFDGGAWVYECLDPGSFRRRRVEVDHYEGTQAVLHRGPAVGTCIVGVGALELLGAELGVSH